MLGSCWMVAKSAHAAQPRSGRHLSAHYGCHAAEGDKMCWRSADEEAEQLIRRGADAAARMGASSGAEDDDAQRSAFNTLKLIRQLLIADRRQAATPPGSSVHI